MNWLLTWLGSWHLYQGRHWTRRGKLRLSELEVGADAYVRRCSVCDNDFATYGALDTMCEECPEEA